MKNKSKKYTITGWLIIFQFISFFAQAQWLNLNPGAGGQIQGVSCNPDIPGKMYMNSDMEGNYLSNDYGKSWSFIGSKLSHRMALTTVAEPGNSKRLYCGTLNGLYISDDEGVNWREASGSLRGKSIACVVIDTSNPSNIYASNSWLIKNTTKNKIPAEPVSGKREIWISKDRGITWQSKEYESVEGYKQCYTITIHPQNKNEIFLGAHSGLYRSSNAGDSFEKISYPSGMTSCRGFDITADGQIAYAVFAENESETPSQTYVFAASVNSSANWIWQEIASPQVNNGLFYSVGRNTYYWKPVIDPRSSSGKHKVIIGCMVSTSVNGQGLYEFDGTVESNKISGAWKLIFAQSGYAGFSYEAGWNNLIPQVRNYTYTPLSWPQRKVFLASQQSAYYGDPEYLNESPVKYECLTSEATGQFGPYVTYKSRGMQSTVTFDAAAWKNYMIQAQADNRFVESWDYGVTWTQKSRPSGSGESGDFVDIIPANGTNKTLVIAAFGGPYGGVRDASDGTLVAKFLSDIPSPNDNWVSLENGESGLPNRRSRIYHSAINPINPANVILLADTCLYETKNIYLRLSGQGGKFESIGPVGNWWYGKVWFDPENPNLIYCHSTQNIYKASRSSISENWFFEKLYSGSILSCDFWKYNGQTIIAFSENDRLYLSSDGGKSFKMVLDEAGIERILEPYPSMFWSNGTPMSVGIRGISGLGNRIYCGNRTVNGNASLGMLEGVIQPNGTVVWNDWSGNGSGHIHYAGVWEGKIISNIDKNGQKKNYYLASTWGNGLWIREADIPTTAKSIKNSNDLKIFPNPATRNITILNEKATGNISRVIEIWTLNGKLQQVESFTDNQITIGLAHLPVATYLLVYRENGIIRNKRIFSKIR